MESSDETGAGNAAFDVVYGKKAWHGPVGFVGGAALLGAAVWLFLLVGFGTRGATRLPVVVGIIGIVVLAKSFHVQGAQLTPEGLSVWNYWCWFLGGTKLLRPDEIERVVLGGKDGKFTVCAKLRDGGEHPIPGTWAALKDAQAIVGLCTTLYGAAAGVDISDGKLLEEAATFAAAQRWNVRPAKALSGGAERLVFSMNDDETMGEVSLLRRMFSRSRAEIADGPGDLPSNGARWTMSDRFLGSRVDLVENGVACEEVRFGQTFTGNACLFHWFDSSGVYWSAVLSCEDNKRTPFTLRFYRGLAEKVGTKAERAAATAKQGEAVLVAVADGPAEDFSVDVADAAAWPWVRIALAAMWLKHRPTFTFAK